MQEQAGQGIIADNGAQESAFSQRSAKLKTDLEVVMENIVLTNNIIDTCVDEKRADDLLPEMIVTLEALNQKMNRLVENLQDKNEASLFNMVLLIVEDINITKGRYKSLMSNKRPQPFISAFKNNKAANGEEEVEEPKQKPQPKKKALDEDDDEPGPQYNQFQFKEADDDEEDAKESYDHIRPQQQIPQYLKQQPQQPTNVQSSGNFWGNQGQPQQPIPVQRPPQQQVQTSGEFWGNQPTQQPQQPPRQQQQIPAQRKQQEDFDLLGQDVSKKPAAPPQKPANAGQIDLLGTGIAQPHNPAMGLHQPPLGMNMGMQANFGMGAMGGLQHNPGMGTMGFGNPGYVAPQPTTSLLTNTQ